MAPNICMALSVVFHVSKLQIALLPRPLRSRHLNPCLSRHLALFKLFSGKISHLIIYFPQFYAIYVNRYLGGNMGFVPRRDQPPNRGRCSSFDEEGLTSPFPTLVSVLLYLLDNTSPVSSPALISRITLLAKRCDRSVYIVNKTITLRTGEISKLRHRTFLTKSRCHLSLRYRRTSQELTKLTTVGTLVICFATLSGALRYDKASSIPCTVFTRTSFLQGVHCTLRSCAL